MKNIISIIIMTAAMLTLITSAAPAATSLYQWGMNVNGSFFTGNIYGGNSLDDVPGLNHESFSESQGIGSMTWTYTATSDDESMLFISWMDHEIDEYTNGFINEFGGFHGATQIDQQWEIDEPMYVFGDIAWNVKHGHLDSSNSLPHGCDPTHDGRPGDDVSMALGWTFDLNTGDTADISLVLTENMDDINDSLFYLTHTDSDSGTTIYYQGVAEITLMPTPVPIPETGLLLISALTTLTGLKKLKILS